MKLRCSELDRVMTCRASAFPQPGEVLIDHESGDAARIGNAVHAIMADIVSKGWQSVPDVRPYCEDAGCEKSETDVRILCYNGMTFLREYRKFLSETPIVEKGFEVAEPWGLLTGHPDIVDYVEAGGERIVYVIDWKTGDKDEDSRYRYQMLGYADIGLTRFAEYEPQRIIVTIAWLRSKEQTTRSYEPSDVNRFDADLAYTLRVRDEAPPYTPGDACRYCPRIAVCPGRRQLMLAAIDVLTGERSIDMVPYDGRLVDASAFARSILQARMLKKLCDDHLKMAADSVRTLGGEVVAPNGQKVVLVSKAGRPTLKAEKVLPYLRERFGEITDEELAEMVSLSKGGVESFLGIKAARGEKKALKEEVFGLFEQTGAMTRAPAIEYVEVKEA